MASRFHVFAVNRGYLLRIRQAQQLGQLARLQTAPLQHRTHGSIEHQVREPSERSAKILVLHAQVIAVGQGNTIGYR